MDTLRLSVTRSARCSFFCALTVVACVLVCTGTSFSQPQSLIDQFEIRSHTHGELTLPYRLFVPAGYDSSREYPLVLALHGSGERGSDNVAQIQIHRMATTWADRTSQAKYPAFVVAPQAPGGGTWAGGVPTPVRPEMVTVLDLLDSLSAEFSIDPDRVYVTGLSMGGFGTFDAVFRDPGRFAAAVPMSGGYDRKVASDFGNIPFFVFHGERDPTVPSVFSRQVVFELEQLGRSVIYTHCGPFDCQLMSEEQLDAAMATRPDLIYTGYSEGEHVIWAESYDNPRLHDWLFKQHRLLPDAIQMTSPVGYPTLSGILSVEWTAPNPAHSLEIWFSPDNGRSWQLVEAMIPNSGSYDFDSSLHADTPFGMLRLMLIDAEGFVYAQQRSESFMTKNTPNAEPAVQLFDFPFRDSWRWIEDSQTFGVHDGRVIEGSTLSLTFRAGDAESGTVDGILSFRSQGGPESAEIGFLDVPTSPNTQTVEVDLSLIPNDTDVFVELSVNDGQWIGSDRTPVFRKFTERLSSSYVEHSEGFSGATISINFVNPDMLTGHRYRITFDVAEQNAPKNAGLDETSKTYSVTDLDLNETVLLNIPVSAGESPPFDGIRLEIQDLAVSRVDAEHTEWSVGDTDTEVTISSPRITMDGELVNFLATPADYWISITESVVDTSLALFGIESRPMRFKVENKVSGEMNQVLFVDRDDDGVPSSRRSATDELYILEEDTAGRLFPAWKLDFREKSIPVDPGDVFVFLTLKTISSADVFEFIGAISVAVEDERPASLDHHLGENYPNPFARATTIPYHLATSAEVELTVYDLLGRRIVLLSQEVQPSGDHSVDWGVTNIPSGVYFYRLRAGSFVQTRTMLLVK